LPIIDLMKSRSPASIAVKGVMRMWIVNSIVDLSALGVLAPPPISSC
jgi:hypothetical protein